MLLPPCLLPSELVPFCFRVSFCVLPEADLRRLNNTNITFLIGLEVYFELTEFIGDRVISFLVELLKLRGLI